MKLRLIPKLLILPDPKVPMYKPIWGWKEWLPESWISKEFCFIFKQGAVYVNPKVLDILRNKMGVI